MNQPFSRFCKPDCQAHPLNLKRERERVASFPVVVVVVLLPLSPLGPSKKKGPLRFVLICSIDG